MKFHTRKKFIVVSTLIFFLGMMMICSLQANNDLLTRVDMDDLSQDSELMANGWSALKKMSNYAHSIAPSIAIDSSNNLHAVWDDESGFQYVVWNKTTGIWQGKVNSTDNLTLTNGFSPNIAVDPQGAPHIVYQNGSVSIAHVYWNASLGTWNFSDIIMGDSYGPRIAIDSSGNRHVISGNSSNMHHRVYNASQQAWSAVVNISVGQYSLEEGSIAIDNNGNVHLAYKNGTGIIKNVYYKLWNITTMDWGTEVLLSDGTDSANEPNLVVEPEGNIHVIWRNGSGVTYDIWHKIYNNSTKTWGTSQEILSNADCYDLALNVDNNGNLHFGIITMVGSDYTVQYMKWTKTTGTWSTPVIVSAKNSDHRAYLTIATDTLGTVHVMWSDPTPDAALHTSQGDTWVVYRGFTPTSSTPPIDPLTLLLILTLIFGPAGAVVALGFLYPRLKRTS